MSNSEELTLREFVAHLIYTLESQGPKVHWQASSQRHRDSFLNRAAKAFENWKQREREAKEARDAIFELRNRNR